MKNVSNHDVEAEIFTLQFDEKKIVSVQLREGFSHAKFGWN